MNVVSSLFFFFFFSSPSPLPRCGCVSVLRLHLLSSLAWCLRESALPSSFLGILPTRFHL